MNAVLRFEDVSKSYRRGGATSLRNLLTASRRDVAQHDVLRRIDLTVREGDVVGLVGRNGGGKSTMLRLAAGSTTPTRGRVERTARASGLLSLGSSANDELTGRDNAVTMAVLAGLSPAAARARLPQIAEFAGLEDVLDDPLRTYSDGMKVRLSFAAAVLTEPRLLLVDEVLAVGDLAFQEKCLDEIARLRDSGCAVLVASHVLDHLHRLATRVVWLRDGLVHADGPPGEVLEAYSRSADETSGAVHAVAGEGWRRGTGRVLIDDVSLHDAEGRGLSALHPGSALNVRVSYVNPDGVENAHASVSLRRAGADGPVVDVTTGDGGAPPVRLAGAGLLELHLDRLDLKPGRYWVDTGVFSVAWDETYDYRWDWRSVVLLGEAMGGAVQPPHRWTAR